MTGLFGRTVIYSDREEITDENVVDVLSKAETVHAKNRAQIEYLYNYYKGDQPILLRKKEIRPEINNKIVVNRANEIVTFFGGYIFGAPVQYTNRGDVKNNEALNKLNEYVFAEDNDAKNKELADWMLISGTSYKMALPDKTGEEDDAPFEIYILDPRDTYIVYYSGIGNKPLMSVKCITREDGVNVRSVYTANKYYEIWDGILKVVKPHSIGMIPVVEYPANPARLGAFEIVLPLLDAENECASDRLDAIEQFVQSLMIFKGVDIKAEDYAALREQGAIKVPMDGDVKYLIQELNQSQTQTNADDLYEKILTICGMPNRNGGTSTSDTGMAVVLRDGWSAAETRAQNIEASFKKSEKQFLRLLLQYADDLRGLNLKLSSVAVRFTRRNYENILQKSQVLTTMLNNDQIHPRLAFQHCGMFTDPDLAYQISEEYAERRRQEEEKEIERFAQQQIEQSKAEANNKNDETAA